MTRTLAALVVASLLAAPVLAQDEARPRKKKAPKPVVEEEAPADEEAAPEEEAPAPPAPRKKNGKKAPPPEEAAPAQPASFEKALLETYLKERTQRIKDMHKGQMKFIADEVETWNQFWNKLKDDRMLFEVRIARQRLDLFDSLSSLDPRDQGPSIADFEKLQANVIRAFEVGQKQKMQDFFLSREARWKDFASVQERDRQELVADAESSWRDQKASSRGEQVSDEPKPKKKAKKVKEPEEDEEESAAAEEKPRPKPKRPTRVEDTFKFGPP